MTNIKLIKIIIVQSHFLNDNRLISTTKPLYDRFMFYLDTELHSFRPDFIPVNVLCTKQRFFVFVFLLFIYFQDLLEECCMSSCADKLLQHKMVWVLLLVKQHGRSKADSTDVESYPVHHNHQKNNTYIYA